MESSGYGLEKLKRTTERLHHDSLCQYCDFIQVHLKYKSQAIPQELNCSTPPQIKFEKVQGYE
jgi:hypothetical protein